MKWREECPRSLGVFTVGSAQASWRHYINDRKWRVTRQVKKGEMLLRQNSWKARAYLTEQEIARDGTQAGYKEERSRNKLKVRFDSPTSTQASTSSPMSSYAKQHFRARNRPTSRRHQRLRKLPHRSEVDYRINNSQWKWCPASWETLQNPVLTWQIIVSYRKLFQRRGC